VSAEMGGQSASYMLAEVWQVLGGQAGVRKAEQVQEEMPFYARGVVVEVGRAGRGEGEHPPVHLLSTQLPPALPPTVPSFPMPCHSEAV